MDYKLIKKIFFDLFKVDKIDYGKTKVLTVAHDNDRGFFYHGKYYSQLIDSVEDDLKQRGIECISIARIISTVKGDIAYGNVFSPEGSFARALVMKRIKGFIFKKGYPYSTMEEKIWGKILDRTGAEKVIAILPSRELCNACHKRKIWVADMQHGVIAENHPWYGKKYRSSDPPHYLPNAFLVWDEGSAQVLNSYCKEKNIDVIPIGNRWVARFIQPVYSDKMVKELIESNNLPSSNKKNILISLSWGCEGIENGIIPESLISIIEKTSEKYSWLLRLHPNQLKGFATHESKKFFTIFEKRLKKYAIWDIPTKMPLPTLLQNIDIHISWNSSVAIEAAQMGIKSALIDPRLRRKLSGDYYNFYHKNGMIDFIEDDETVIREWINKHITSSKQRENYDSFNNTYLQLLDFISNG